MDCDSFLGLSLISRFPTDFLIRLYTLEATNQPNQPNETQRNPTKPNQPNQPNQPKKLKRGITRGLGVVKPVT